MRLLRYRGRHLRRRPRGRGAVVVGATASVWLTGAHAHAATHTVARGETLSGIAARYGTSVVALARANGIADPDVVVAGTTLTVPGPGAATAAATHTVARGETLSGIAARYGTSVVALARANGIADPDLVVAGTTLRVSASAPVAAPAAPAPAPVPAGSVEALLEHHAATHGVDPALVKAVAWQESGWQQHVVSPVGAIGVMQVMPDTARFVNRSLGHDGLDVRAADGNVHLGVAYLRHLLDTMPSEEAALAAYVSGPGNVGAGLDRVQRRYVDAVAAHRARF
ncbi:MAG TPA: LysM peptidoglycan-binding domain-containing protein [Actinomycetota bacterium]|nr:LysM peptidoglycan-binding domain-containing protein [Actinomycetota bacterium]